MVFAGSQCLTATRAVQGAPPGFPARPRPARLAQSLRDRVQALLEQVSREELPDADVRSPAEGDVSGVAFALGIESQRIGKGGRIASRTQSRLNKLSRS